MKSIFEDFYYKKLGRNEMKPKDREYLESLEEYEKAYETLEQTLDETQKKLLDDVFFSSAGVTGVLEYLSYKEGFRVALLLAFEMIGEPSPN
ncbi:MAG: hypothetical protein K2G44_02985 [Clostridia bacterium]|nr:hypothetical protein [Clostridia bacterium]